MVRCAARVLSSGGGEGGGGGGGVEASKNVIKGYCYTAKTAVQYLIQLKIHRSLEQCANLVS